MPIYFFSVLSQQGKIVLYATYEKNQLGPQIEENRGVCKLYQTITFEYSKSIKIVYRNLGSITCAIVHTNEVDLQEVGEFFDEVLEHIQSKVLGMSLYQPPKAEENRMTR